MSPYQPFESSVESGQTWFMSKPKHAECPLCQTELDVVDVAPCAECGHLTQEIEHALAGKHLYAEMQVFGDLSVVLCDFCQVDFGSYDPEYFGLPSQTRIGYDKMQWVRAVEVFIGKDKFCPQCNSRLAFLEFVVAARQLHQFPVPSSEKI